MAKEVEKKESESGGTLADELKAMNDFVPLDEDEEEKKGSEEEENEEEEVDDDSEEEEEDDGEDEDDDEEDEDKSPKPDPVLKDIQEKLDKLALKSDEAEDVKEEKSEEPDVDSELDFLEDIDMEELTSDKATLNKLLNKVVGVAHERGRISGAKEAKEAIFRNLPTLIKNNTDQQSELKEAATAFYKNNPDLVEWKGACAAVANEVASADPGMKLSKLFEKTEKIVRERLNLKKQAVEKKRTKKGPKFAKTSSGKSGKKGGSKLTGVEADIADMNNSNN